MPPAQVVATDVSAERLQALQQDQLRIITKQLDVTDAHAVTDVVTQVPPSSRLQACLLADCDRAQTFFKSLRW